MSRETSSDRYFAGALAALVHLLLFVVLVFGVSWKRLPDQPVYADLWRDLPSPHAVAKPEPKPPAPTPAPKPVPPPPKPKPVNEVKKPDIALKAEKKRAQEQKEEEARQRLAAMMQQAEKQRLAKEAQQLQARMAQEKLAAEQQKKQAQEKARKNLDQLLAQQMNQELNQESQAIRQDLQSSARSKEMADYVNRIRQKIRGFVRIPPNLQGNPEAVFRVDLLPDGEVVHVTQVRSSGQPVYDQEVERAIWKASPFPLPPDRQTAAAFRDGLNLTFTPHDR